MVLQTLDIKNNCQGIYLDGNFILDPSEDDLSKYKVAWKHSPMLKEDEKYRYLYLSLKNEDLSTIVSIKGSIS